MKIRWFKRNTTEVQLVTFGTFTMATMSDAIILDYVAILNKRDISRETWVYTILVCFS